MKISPVERFMSHVIPEPNSGCWLWTSHAINGYSRFNFRGKAVMGHRFSYESFVGPVPDGLTIDHKCRVRCCVNPKHLEPVTHQENVRRAYVTRTHCRKGHEYTEENTVVYPGRTRTCIQCKNKAQRELYAKYMGASA